jgi:hypothetical protein
MKGCDFVMAKGVGKKKLLQQAGTTDLIETLRITLTMFLFMVIVR